MATKLFKDGEFVWVEAERVANHLAAGWSAEDPLAPKPQHPPTILPAGMGLEQLSPENQEAAILRQMNILPGPVPAPARAKRKSNRRASA